MLIGSFNDCLKFCPSSKYPTESIQNIFLLTVKTLRETDIKNNLKDYWFWQFY